jgi:hypothetical protein
VAPAAGHGGRSGCPAPVRASQPPLSNRLQFAAEPAPATDGNLYAPVSDGRAEARGGWRRRPDPPPQLRRLAAVGLLAAGSITIARIVTRSGRT